MCVITLCLVTSIFLFFSETTGLSSLDSVSITASCQEKCGKLQQYPCSCDARCVVYRTCCEDFNSVCQLTSEKANRKYERFLNLDIECSIYSETLVISSCREENNTILERILLENESWDFLNNSYIVRDITEDLVYKNLYIYICNNRKIDFPVFWSLRLLNQTRPALAYCKLSLQQSEVVMDVHYFGNMYIHTKKTCKLTRRNEQHQNIIDQIYVGNINEFCLRVSYTEISETCNFLDFETALQMVSNDYALIEYSFPVIKVKYIYFIDNRYHPWDTLVCDTSHKTHSYVCNWTFANCNTKAGFVLKNNTCKRQYLYNFLFPLSEWFHELQHSSYVPHLMYCLLKHHLRLDMLDEWLPPREVTHPHYNTSFFTVTFIVYLLEPELSFNYKKFISYLELIIKVMKMYHMETLETQNRSNRLGEDEKISEKPKAMKNNTFITQTNFDNFICFKKKALLLYSESDREFIYDFKITDFKCFYEKESNLTLRSFSRPDMVACLNSCIYMSTLNVLVYIFVCVFYPVCW